MAFLQFHVTSLHRPVRNLPTLYAIFTPEFISNLLLSGVVQFPPPPSTVMDRVTDRVRDRDMGRVRDRVRLRGLAIAASSYSGP